MKKAIVSVINDLATDQRVNRTCTTLLQLGYTVTLVGRNLPNSLILADRPYFTYRMNLFFKKGPFFYLEYTIRLFFYLLFNKADLLFANDLDTLIPNFMVSKIKGSKLVYDTHELFTEVPELEQGGFKKQIWTSIEKQLFPQIKTVITVNQSIADYYSNLYKKDISVVRNIPHSSNFKNINLKTRNELGMPTDKRILIMQGSGINIHRGSEEVLEAMQYIDNAVLYIIGGGDVIATLKKMTGELKLNDKVVFIDKLPFHELIQYTFNADLGLTLDKANNINYQFSLPNKLFDYIHCGIPILSSQLIEIKKIIDQYQIGDFIPSHNPKDIADKINAIFKTDSLLKKWKENVKIAKSDLNWENEEKILISAIKSSE